LSDGQINGLSAGVGAETVSFESAGGCEAHSYAITLGGAVMINFDHFSEFE
jgi:hypothetical protein